MLFPERPITVEHIRAFCAKFNEGYRVEYKSTFDASVRDKTPKVLSSFANSHGGVLVIGVDTLNGVPQPPFQGFQPPPREEFALTVENICLQNIYPPLLPRTSVVPSDVASCVFVVIEVDESSETPHAIENSRKVYVRTGNASNPYDLADVDLILELVKRRQEPFERRQMLIDRAKKRFKSHRDVKVAGRAAGTIPRDILLQLSIGPRYPSRQLRREEDLKILVQNFTQWRGFMFPDPGKPILSQRESSIVLDAAKGTSFFEVSVWGMLFYGANLRVEAKGTSGIALDALLGYVLFFLRHAGQMLQSLGYSGLVDIDTALSPMQNVQWLHEWHGYPVALPGSELDDELALMTPTASDALREKRDGVAMEIFRHVFFSVNLFDLVDTPGKLRQLVHRGYAFNGWPPTEDLLV